MITIQPVKRKILLNPGPATTTDSVKLAQIVPDICPREEEFGEVMKDVTERITKFAGDPEQYTTVLFGGSGTAAVEAIISSAVGIGGIFIINNGAYGNRMCEIAETYGLKMTEFKSPSDQPVNIEKLEEELDRRNGKITHLAVVHCETSTGLLNDIKLIGQVCRQRGIKLIVDAMSSFGAVPVNMKEMNISFLAASSNKNLQGMAGAAFVIAENTELEDLNYIKPRSYYLSLFDQYSFFKKYGQMRFTPPVQTIYALEQAVTELEDEGISNRYKRYSGMWQKLVLGLKEMGLTHQVKKENHSRIVTSIMEPDCPAYSFPEMHDFFKEKDITVYPGKTGEENTFRIANIGDLHERDIDEFLFLLKSYLRIIGYQSKTL
ncbi:2-aminoethylphosphonate aminotransferase [Evansella clarkii]|uniref:2-aminoethylphosphonate aminotransferase n=1 Tax=Evansella clarkii TaxID=79879 RepID=UPI0030B82B32